jgi:hypothetical protein
MALAPRKRLADPSSAILRLDSFKVSASKRAAMSTFIDSTQRALGRPHHHVRHDEANAG